MQSKLAFLSFFPLVLQFCYALQLQTAMCHCLSPPEINPSPRHQAASPPIHPWQRNTGSQAGFSHRKRFFRGKVGQRMWLPPAEEDPLGASLVTLDAALLVVSKGKSEGDQRPVMFLLGVTQCTLIGLLGPAAVDRHQRRTSCSNEAKQGGWHVSAPSHLTTTWICVRSVTDLVSVHRCRLRCMYYNMLYTTCTYNLWFS